MSYQQQHVNDSSNKRLCQECKKSGYDIEVIRLSTFGQRDTNLVNLDGSKHLHFYSPNEYEWNTLYNV
jgi:hypothetical protein